MFFLEEKPQAKNSSKSQSLIYLIPNLKNYRYWDHNNNWKNVGFINAPSGGQGVESVYQKLKSPTVSLMTYNLISWLTNMDVIYDLNY